MNRRNYSHAIGVACLFAAHAMIIVYPEEANAETIPLRWWGELGYDYHVEHYDQGEDLVEHIGILRLNGASYIYKPWFATVEAGVGFNLRRSQHDSGFSDSDNIIGDAKLRMFPESKFPLELFAESTDSSTDTDLTGLELDRKRYGFLQRYTTDAGTAFKLGYEQADQTTITTGLNGDIETREDQTDLVVAGFNKVSGPHNIVFDATANKVDMVDSPDLNRTLFSTLRHTYRPNPKFSAEDMLTYNSSEIIQGTTEFTTDLFQLNSFGFWRPDTRKPLRVNASFRFLSRDTEIRFSNPNTAYTGSGTLGATYEWDQNWLFNGNAGFNVLNSDAENSTSTNQAINAIYTSDTSELLSLDASWFGQADVRNLTEEDSDSIQGAGGQLGYNLGRNITSRRNTAYNFNLRQSVSMVADTERFSSQTLLTNIGLSWNQNAGNRSSMARLSISDSRTNASGEQNGEIDGEFQLINFQASVDQRINSNSSLRGNITFQTTRNERPEIEGVIDEGNGEWTPTSTIDVTYINQRTFGVPMLTFRSTVRFVSNSYVAVLDEPDLPTDRDDKQWENRLEYYIGRLQLRAIARISEIQGTERTFFLFQARRMIGDR